MNYVYLTIIVIILSIGAEKYKKSKALSFLILAIIMGILCTFAGLRNSYNDTGTYIRGFNATSGTLSNIWKGEKFQISNVYLFQIWNWLIYNIISHDVHVYLWLSSAVFVIPAVYFIYRYSYNFTISMIMFMLLGTYLFSMAGLKQAMAMGVMVIGIDRYINKKLISYYVCCILAMGLHTYAIVYLFVPLLGRELWNIPTKVFCIGILILGLFFSQFTGVMTALIEFLGKDVSEETLTSGAVNVWRVIAHLVPFIFSILAGKKVKTTMVVEQIVFSKLGVLTSLFMFLAAFGNPILFGRIPHYFMIGELICLPYLIKKCFIVRDRQIVYQIAIICYCVFGWYSLYTDGAFARDIFRFNM